MRMVGADALGGPARPDGLRADHRRRGGRDPGPGSAPTRCARDADPERAWRASPRSRAPLAVLLMDQTVIAGVGNVYRAEVLFRHGLDPMLPGRGAAPRAVGRVVGRPGGPAARRRAPRPDRHRAPEHAAARSPAGRRAGTGTAARSTSTAAPGEPCLVCGTEVPHVELAGRNLYWCPICQPRLSCREPRSRLATPDRVAATASRGRHCVPAAISTGMGGLRSRSPRLRSRRRPVAASAEVAATAVPAAPEVAAGRRAPVAADVRRCRPRHRRPRTASPSPYPRLGPSAYPSA